MRENDEFIGHVEDYLVEFDGDTPLPGHVMDAIHAELPRTRQAKAGPGFMRMPPMLSTISSRAPWGFAAAAVVVVLVLGATFIYRNTDQSGVGAAPAPSATPVPNASAPPASFAGTSDHVTLTNAPRASCPGITEALECLEPGTYQLGTTLLWPAVVTLDVPANWWYYTGGTGHTGVLVQTEDITNGSGWGVTFNTIGSVSTDPCDPTAGTLEKDALTPVEIYEAIAAWPGFDATEPVPIEKGYEGLRFTLTSKTNAADCGNSVMWTTANGVSVDAYPMVNGQGRSLPVDFQIVGTDGGPLVIAAMNFPETSPWEEQNGHAFDPEAHVDHQVELAEILDSIRIEPREQP